MFHEEAAHSLAHLMSAFEYRYLRGSVTDN